LQLVVVHLNIQSARYMREWKIDVHEQKDLP
jgi:hypothetical protein